MSASQTSRWTAAKAAGESAGWKEVWYSCDIKSDLAASAAWNSAAATHMYPWSGKVSLGTNCFYRDNSRMPGVVVTGSGEESRLAGTS